MTPLAVGSDRAGLLSLHGSANTPSRRFNIIFHFFTATYFSSLFVIFSVEILLDISQQSTCGKLSQMSDLRSHYRE